MFQTAVEFNSTKFKDERAKIVDELGKAHVLPQFIIPRQGSRYNHKYINYIKWRLSLHGAEAIKTLGHHAHLASAYITPAELSRKISYIDKQFSFSRDQWESDSLLRQKVENQQKFPSYEGVAGQTGDVSSRQLDTNQSSIFSEDEEHSARVIRSIKNRQEQREMEATINGEMDSTTFELDRESRELLKSLNTSKGAMHPATDLHLNNQHFNDSSPGSNSPLGLNPNIEAGERLNNLRHPVSQDQAQSSLGLASKNQEVAKTRPFPLLGKGLEFPKIIPGFEYTSGSPPC